MTQKDKIKIAILDHSPDLGGAEIAILTFLKNIDRSRFDVAVILPSRGTFSKVLEESSIPLSIIHLPIGLIRLKRGKAFQSFFFLLASLFFFQFFLLNLCIHLKKNRFQLILTNTVKAHLYGSVAASLCSIPLVWRFHDILSPKDFSPFLIRWIALFGKLFPKRIFAVSKITWDHLVNKGIQSRKVEVIFNAIDHERFEVKKEFKNIRDEFHLGDRAKVVGCIGRVLPQKGQKPFLLAVPEVIRKYPETFFLIVGDVPSNQRPFMEDLLKTIKEKKIEDHVKFTGFRSDIGDVLQSLDIVVFPSIAPESFGLSVLEAMSAGKPVIATNTGGVCEMINDGINGIIIEKDHPEQIAERIIYLLNHREVRDRMGEEAKTSVRQKFSLERSVRAIEIALQEAVREVNP